MNQVSELSWEPVRNGETYCSSACGGGCTIDSYLQAVENAHHLCKELGSGWFPHVWENLGWHYSAKSANDQVEVHETRYTGGVHYTAYAGGKADNGDTPREAIENIRARLTRMRDEAQTNLDGIPVFPVE
jgi:hypothetical protein